MEISENSRSKIVDELRYAASKMREEEESARKLFFFSACYGMTNRVLNSEWDRELQIVDFVLNLIYNTVKVRADQIKTGDRTVLFPTDFWEKLTLATERLAEVISNRESCYEVLQDFVIISYVTIGNGYYLLQKGKITLP